MQFTTHECAINKVKYMQHKAELHVAKNNIRKGQRTMFLTCLACYKATTSSKMWFDTSCLYPG